MRVDRDVLLRLFVQRNLQVGVREVEFREGLASRERGVELFNAGNGIPLAFGGSVDSYLVVTAYPHSSVALPDGNYGRGPVRELHRSQNSKKYL